MPDPIKLKGINFSGYLGAYEREFGAERRSALEASVAEPLRSALANREILASGWYPVAWYDALLAGVEGDVAGEEEVRRIGGLAVEHDFRTLFRLVRLFLKPQFTLKQTVRISARYFDGGDVEVIAAEEELIHYQFRNYHGFTQRIWWDFTGGIEAVLRSLDCKDIRRRVVSGGTGADLEVVFRWRR